MLIKYSGKYVKIYFNMKITFFSSVFSIMSTLPVGWIHLLRTSVIFVIPMSTFQPMSTLDE